MELKAYQEWISTFYKKRGWYALEPFVRIGFLAEETGEVAQAVRALEIGRDRPDEAPQAREVLLQDLTEELGDVLDNLFILADKYDIRFEDILISHKNKLEARFEAVDQGKQESL
jgi:NTP pyrophosphatase (non-canonical NTP hydrolase)